MTKTTWIHDPFRTRESASDGSLHALDKRMFFWADGISSRIHDSWPAAAEAYNWSRDNRHARTGQSHAQMFALVKRNQSSSDWRRIWPRRKRALTFYRAMSKFDDVVQSPDSSDTQLVVLPYLARLVNRYHRLRRLNLGVDAHVLHQMACYEHHESCL